jgi:hypothetical protein
MTAAPNLYCYRHINKIPNIEQLIVGIKQLNIDNPNMELIVGMSELNINTDIDYIVNRINPGNKPYLIALSISLIDNIGFTKEQVCAIFAK